MRNLFNPADAEELKARLTRLPPTAMPKWGSMTVAQMLWHCVEGFKLSTGELQPPRPLLGRLIGRTIKKRVLGAETPFIKNAPTAEALDAARASVVHLDFEQQRAAFIACIDRFVTGGPAPHTGTSHFFFGRLTPDEWAELGYKHLDHHLRQFGG